MNLTDLMELIRNGENSKVEFKRDDAHPRKLAAEIAALLNLEGGHIILGVEDHGKLSGLTREPARAEEWVMQIARDHIQPSTFLAPAPTYQSRYSPTASRFAALADCRTRSPWTR